MRIGVTLFATDRTLPPHELAREAETRGFHSVYFPEHTHIPTCRRTPPPTGEAELADEYRRTLDPVVALAAAAAVTSRIRLGTAVALVAQHDAIAHAKALATLDHLSGGRLVLGVGYGWNREEMEDHGVDPKRRRALVREKMLAMQALWSGEVAEFRGELVQLQPSWAWPKPLQQPRPLTLLGGVAGRTLFAHVAEWADGWMPIGGSGLHESLPLLREAVAARGRDPASLEVVPIGVLPDPTKLAYYEEIGVTEAVLRLPPAGREAVLPVLDRYARYVGG